MTECAMFSNGGFRRRPFKLGHVTGDRHVVDSAQAGTSPTALSRFDGDLSSWDVSAVESFDKTFECAVGACRFRGDGLSGWDYAPRRRWRTCSTGRRSSTPTSPDGTCDRCDGHVWYVRRTPRAFTADVTRLADGLTRGLAATCSSARTHGGRFTRSAASRKRSLTTTPTRARTTRRRRTEVR